MKKIYINILCILLLPIALLLNFIASKYPNMVETVYSTTINKATIEILSFITGWIPFSLYDIFVVVVCIGLIVYIISVIRRCFIYRKNILRILTKGLLNIVSFFSVLYFLFIVLWGINYNRVPFNESIGVSITKHNYEDLGSLYEYLINECNSIRAKLPEDSSGVVEINDYKSIFNRAEKGYNAIDNLYPTLKGNYSKPKYILSSEIFNYTGITGIYFPYTGQANVNVKVPLMTIPATTLHEMAHQRGYAHEDEANFIAYLASINHPDLDFQYSGYLLALAHTSNALYTANIDLLKSLNGKLSDAVMRDLIYKSEFWQKYEGQVSKVSSKINDSYLKSNGVSDGEKSYGRMVDLLLSYYNNL